MSGWIGVDLDGTLAHYGGSNGFRGSGRRNASEVIRYLVIICTCIPEPVLGVAERVRPDADESRKAGLKTWHLAFRWESPESAGRNDSATK